MSHFTNETNLMGAIPDILNPTVDIITITIKISIILIIGTLVLGIICSIAENLNKKLKTK